MQIKNLRAWPLDTPAGRVEPGGTIEIEDDALAASLLDQADKLAAAKKTTKKES